MQAKVQVVAQSHQENSVTLKINARKVTFFLDGDFDYHYKAIHNAIEKGWHNFVIERCLSWSRHSPHIHDAVPNRWEPASVMLKILQEAPVSANYDYTSKPTEEYRWTLIAPTTTNNALSYKGRKWFKSAEDAKQFGVELFEGQPNTKFDLVVLEATDVISSKPRIDVVSTNLRK